MPDSHCCKCCSCSPWVRLGLLSFWEFILGIGLSAIFVIGIRLELLEDEDDSKVVVPQTNSTSSNSTTNLTSSSKDDSSRMPKAFVVTLGLIILILINFLLSFRLCRAAFSRDVSKLRQYLTLVWILCGFLVFAYLCAGEDTKTGAHHLVIFVSFAGAFFYRIFTLLKLGPFISRIPVGGRRVEPAPPPPDPEEDLRFRSPGFTCPRPVDSDLIHDETTPQTGATLRPRPPSYSVAVKAEEEEEEPPTYESVVGNGGAQAQMKKDAIIKGSRGGGFHFN